MKRYIINTDDIYHNIRIIKSACGCDIIGVIKSGGYGLGLVKMAELLKSGGISRFAVTEISDLKELRETVLPDSEILVMRSTSLEEEAEELLHYGGTATVGSLSAVKALEKACENAGKSCPAHIKLDTGMSRYGFLPEETDTIKEAVRILKNADVTGIYTHFNNAFSDDALTDSQLSRFKTAVKKLKASGIKFDTVHAANSAATFKNKGTDFDAVRVGSAFLGRAVVPEKFGLKKVGMLETQVIEIKNIHAGDTVGYLGAFKAKKDMKLAIIPVGNYDGFGMAPASDINDFSVMVHGIMSHIKKFIKGNRIYVSIEGKKCPTVGHIALNHAAVDITGTDISVGNRVKIDINPLYLNSRIDRVFI